MEICLEKDGNCVAVVGAYAVGEYETSIITLVSVYLTEFAIDNNIDISRDTTGYDIVVDKNNARIIWHDCDILAIEQYGRGYYSYLKLVTINERERIEK